MDRAFSDRHHAGRVLARRLHELEGHSSAVVLGLPRGGVPVAYEVARGLSLPLDVFVVRKLGVPGHEEFAMGAIASGGFRLVDWETVAMVRVPDSALDAVIRKEEAELLRRERLYRHGKGPLSLGGRVVLVVDDGLATGASMRAAVTAIRHQQPSRIVVAVPVAAEAACRELVSVADEVVCAVTPEEFRAVGLWYEDFSEVSDEDVRRLVDAASRGRLEQQHPTSGPW